MPLTPELTRQFDGAVQRRGTEYFRADRVRIDSVSRTRIGATVRGSDHYQVELERQGRSIRASCTCPYADTDFCKHLWAVLLTVEDKPLLQGRRLELVLDDSSEAAFDDEDEDDPWDVEEEDEIPVNWVPPPPTVARPAKPPKAESWRQQLAKLHEDAPAYAMPAEPWSANRQLLYVIDAARPPDDRGLYLEVLCRERKKDGNWSKPKARYLPAQWLQHMPNQDDREILALLSGASAVHNGGYSGHYGGLGYGSLPYIYRLRDPQPRILLPMICRTGRCHLRAQIGAGTEYGPPLTWRGGEPWRLRLSVHRSLQGKHYELSGALTHGEARIEVAAALIVPGTGVFLAPEAASIYEYEGASNWFTLLRQPSSLRVPIAQGEAFLEELLRQPRLPQLDLPKELHYEEVHLTPRPRLIVKPHQGYGNADWLQGELGFEYDGRVIVHGQRDRGLIQASERRVLLRDLAAENTAEERLHALGWRWGAPLYRSGKYERTLELAARNLPTVVRALAAEGWHVEVEGKLYRSPATLDLRVSSGVDWFELHGEVKFDEAVVQLPELLHALRKGENAIRLGDGSFGVLPQEWLKQLGMLAGLGQASGDHLRFKRSQAGILDALLATQPETRCDELFARMREELRSFAGIHAQPAPLGFQGELRPYQQDALGWFQFLRQFGFGGCLADDMGLGKTVQVLALLETRRQWHEQQQAAPLESRARVSLAVVPRSLLFNWRREAARFTPRLRVLDHTGNQRLEGWEHFADYDLVLTTYGTLRNDAVEFKDVKFDYIILDEAQAIKNADSVSAKAVRLLQSEHRLALSGTPIENHLGELWSLFQFLNPGMLGSAGVFQSAQGISRNPDENTRKLLAQALRPFILRRTKGQVASELPAKIEQTIYCDLDARQRRLYDELRSHYRTSLLGRVDKSGIGRAKIQILEALLRLRQAAIHPGLLDKGRLAESSAKLDVLLPSVLEATAEGHKTLVFSQFTGVLAILRDRLDREGVVYEYLDGKTRDREARVERFQTNPQCKLFLISLKAGGVGLNLTAAQYVFLLDPWWNPAVEAQAIDRAHRIGQTSQVFAYRLIARDTVEEKVLELQNTKRDLADAIVGANEGLIRHLGREDLELLLS